MYSLPKFLKKILLSFLIGLVLFFSSPVKTYAAGTWYNQSFIEWANKVYDTKNPKDIFGERYTAAQVQWVIYGLFGFIINIPGNTVSDVLQCSGSEAQILACAATVLKTSGLISADIKQEQKSKETLVQAIFQDRPISTMTYFKDAAKNINIIPVANAQTTGFGFTALNPVLELWKSVRNICYSLLVLVIIIMAFMVMFKVKISPQVVITVQSAIPKIIMAVILITFSYAIAGLLIDLMYVVFGIFALALSSVYHGDPVTSFNLLTKGQGLGGDVNLGIWGMFLFYILYFTITLVITLITSLGLTGSLAVGGAATLLSVGTGGLLPALAIIGVCVVIIMLIFMIFKTLWALLKALAGVLLLTIAAPFQILLGVLVPGMGFSSWMKNFVANLATFVTIGVLFQLCFIFLQAAFAALFPNLGTAISHILFGTDPIIQPGTVVEKAWPPLLGTGQGATPMIFVGVSFVLFMTIPKAAELVQSFIKGQPFNFGAAINEVAFNPLTMGFLGLGSSRQQAEYAAEAKRVKETPGAVFDFQKQRAQDVWSIIRSISGGRVK